MGKKELQTMEEFFSEKIKKRQSEIPDTSRINSEGICSGSKRKILDDISDVSSISDLDDPEEAIPKALYNLVANERDLLRKKLKIERLKHKETLVKLENEISERTSNEQENLQLKKENKNIKELNIKLQNQFFNRLEALSQDSSGQQDKRVLCGKQIENSELLKLEASRDDKHFLRNGLLLFYSIEELSKRSKSGKRGSKMGVTTKPKVSPAKLEAVTGLFYEHLSKSGLSSDVQNFRLQNFSKNLTSVINSCQKAVNRNPILSSNVVEPSERKLEIEDIYN